MAERRATNKYYPPEWDPSHGSINQYVRQKQHLPATTILKQSAEPADQLVSTEPKHASTKTIRFELPFSIWCLGCERHLAKNVRFNAEKRQTGWYHRTAIYEFRMSCPSCPQQIIVRTDPMNTDYLVVSGGKRKTEMQSEDAPSDNPFAQLEAALNKERAAEEAKPALNLLQSETRKIWSDDYKSSQLVRRAFRDEEKKRKSMVDNGTAVALTALGLSCDRSASDEKNDDGYFRSAKKSKNLDFRNI